MMLWCSGWRFIRSRVHSGFGNYSLPTSFNCLSEQGRGWGLEGCTGLPALQSVSCLSRSCMVGKGHGRLVCKYTWSIGCCATWCNTPDSSSCRSLVVFKPLNSSFWRGEKYCRLQYQSFILCGPSPWLLCSPYWWLTHESGWLLIRYEIKWCFFLLVVKTNRLVQAGQNWLVLLRYFPMIWQGRAVSVHIDKVCQRGDCELLKPWNMY